MTYFTADLHLFDEKIAQWRGFKSIDEYHTLVLSNWFRKVNSKDNVYILGDITMSNIPGTVRILERLPGHKALIPGNHDNGVLYNWLKDDWSTTILGGSIDFNLGTDEEPFNIICSHIPVHPDELQWYKGNVHGHIHHANPPAYVPYGVPSPKNDPRYFNVNLEFHDYKPVSIETLKQHFK